MLVHCALPLSTTIGSLDRGGPANWEQMFAGYWATVDWPGAAFYKELTQRYPEAKVILTVCDPERWYESARNTIFNLRGAEIPRAPRIAQELASQRGFDGPAEDRGRMIEAFNE